ncbi:MAG: ADOP family duplicated permease [Gemmatimonadaceae bacterium]
MRIEHWVYTIPLRLRSLFRREQVERELDEELRYHIERQVEELVARGVSPADARTRALRAMGGVERRKDECRDARGLGRLEDLARDSRYAVRVLRRAPTFTAAAALTLALGIGASAAIFTVVDAVLLRPLPYRASEQLVMLGHAGGQTVAAATFLDWKAAARTFARMAAAEYWTPNLTGGDRPEEMRAIRVGADLLPMLGVRPILGRVFLPQEEHLGRQRVVVLGHGVWERRFAADPRVIGRTIQVDGEPHTIVGVMPRGFRFVPLWAEDAELAAPLVLDHRRTDRQGSSLRAFARMRAGVTLGEARAELAAIGRQMAREHPGTDQSVTAVALQDAVVGSVRASLLILLAAVACVLLIACANVAHLQLMRAAAREREFAVRAALGGVRGRLAQQSLVESALLSAVGGLVGLGLAHAGVRLLVALAPAGRLPRLETIAIDERVLAFALATTAVAALIFGFGPALAASRRDIHDRLRDGGRGTGESVRRRRVRAALVVSELAIALVLLTTAGLVVRSVQSMRAVDAGFDARNVVSMTVSLKGTKQAAPKQRRAAFFQDLLRQVRAVPGVEDASAINHLPMHGDHWHFPFAIEGRPRSWPAEHGSASFRVVQPGYFRTMRVPVLRGRDFTAEDQAAGAHVVVVNETLARRGWPNESPIGQRITVDDPATGPDWFTVVGVVSDVRQGSWMEGSSEEMYFPYLPGPAEETLPLRLVNFLSPVYMTLAVRTTSDAAGMASVVESIVRSMERDAPVSDVVTMEQVIAEEFAQPRFHLLLFGAFAAVALALAVVGVYGVMSYSVARRTREIGLRVALGAAPSGAFRLVAGQGARLALVGVGVGLVIVLGVTRYLRSVLFGVEPTDPTTLVAAALLLGTTAVAACSVPAWRAARVDPMVVLRGE